MYVLFFSKVKKFTYKLVSHLIGKSNKTNHNNNRVSVSIILSWYKAPFDGLDFSLSSSFDFFGTTKIAPVSAAFSRGPSSNEVSSANLHFAEDLVSSFLVLYCLYGYQLNAG